MTGPREGRRDVALTTLIDLLVQIVFVFTLLLIASGAIEGPPEERGYVTPEAWKTLISIFDVDPNKLAPDQAKDIAAKYEAAQRERAAMRERLDKVDARNAQLEKQAGGSGFPPCRAADGEELLVADLIIDSAGKISTSALPGAAFKDAAGLPSLAGIEPLSRGEFRQAFSPWRERGMSRDPRCQFSATVHYDPRAAAGDYQPSLSVIWTIFKVHKFVRERSQ